MDGLLTKAKRSKAGYNAAFRKFEDEIRSEGADYDMQLLPARDRRADRYSFGGGGGESVEVPQRAGDGGLARPRASPAFDGRAADVAGDQQTGRPLPANASEVVKQAGDVLLEDARRVMPIRNPKPYDFVVRKI